MNGSIRLATALLAVLATISVSVHAETGVSSNTAARCPEVTWPTLYLIPHKYDCSRFYVCFGGRAFPSECGLRDTAGNRLYFDEEAQGCVWPRDSSCVSISVGSDDESNESSDESNSSESVEETDYSTEGYTQSTTESGPEIPTECPPTNEGNATHIAHESDCGLFYLCNHGIKILQTCPPGTDFNPVTQVCDWPQNVGCIPGGSGPDDDDDSSTPAEGGSNTTTTQGPNISNATDSGDLEDSNATTTEAGPIFPTECPPTNDGGVILIAHEYDCALFYKCNWGEKVLLSCPNGLDFNPAAQACDWPSNVGCIPGSPGPDDDDDDSSTPAEGGSNTTTTQDPNTPDATDSGDLEDSNATTTEAGPIFPTECPPTNDGGVILIAHEYDCALFYKCNWGEKVLLSCPNGLDFNPAAQACDWPSNVGCIPGSPGPDDDDDDSSTPAEGGSNTTTTQDPNTPDATDSGDLEDSNATTTEAGPIFPTECPPTNDGGVILIAHEYDCALFYKCNWGEKVLLSCPNGLDFNPAAQACDWPSNVGCIPGGPGPDDDDDSSTPAEGGSNTTTTQGPNTPDATDSGDLEDSNATTTEAGPIFPTECPPTNDGGVILIAHEYDCALFYKCNWGEKVLLSCPNGLDFNPAAQACDWPSNVGCIPGSPGPDDDSSTPAEEESWSTTEGESSVTEKTSTTAKTTTSQGPNTPDVTDSSDNEGSGTISTEFPTRCPPANDATVTFIAHDSDCGAFYKCDWGKKVLLKCPSGLAFNPAAQACDWPENVACTTENVDDSNSGVAWSW